MAANNDDDNDFEVSEEETKRVQKVKRGGK